MRASSPYVQMQLKMYFFVLFLCICMHYIMAEFQKVTHAKIACGL